MKLNLEEACIDKLALKTATGKTVVTFMARMTPDLAKAMDVFNLLFLGDETPRRFAGVAIDCGGIMADPCFAILSVEGLGSLLLHCEEISGWKVARWEIPAGKKPSSSKLVVQFVATISSSLGACKWIYSFGRASGKLELVQPGKEQMGLLDQQLQASEGILAQGCEVSEEVAQ